MNIWGSDIKIVDSYKYLGVHPEQQTGLVSQHQHPEGPELCASAEKAGFSM